MMDSHQTTNWSNWNRLICQIIFYHSVKHLPFYQMSVILSNVYHSTDRLIILLNVCRSSYNLSFCPTSIILSIIYHAFERLLFYQSSNILSIIYRSIEDLSFYHNLQTSTAPLESQASSQRGCPQVSSQRDCPRASNPGLSRERPGSGCQQLLRWVLFSNQGLE